MSFVFKNCQCFNNHWDEGWRNLRTSLYMLQSSLGWRNWEVMSWRGVFSFILFGLNTCRHKFWGREALTIHYDSHGSRGILIWKQILMQGLHYFYRWNGWTWDLRMRCSQAMPVLEMGLLEDYSSSLHQLSQIFGKRWAMFINCQCFCEHEMDPKIIWPRVPALHAAIFSWVK